VLTCVVVTPVEPETKARPRATAMTTLTVVMKTGVEDRVGDRVIPDAKKDPSSGDGDGSDDDGSSENDDRVETRATPKRLHIKLQNFDGTSSWESWWAPFQNSATYNMWTRRDKLAFL